MANIGDRGKGATQNLQRRASRDEGLLREVRSLLSRDQASATRLRRLERMEETARAWVNGKELGGSRFDYLSEAHD